MINQEQQHIAPDGFGPAAAQYFSGPAWLKMLVKPDQITNCSVGEVIFEAGVRNNWHTHPSNQILIVTEGIGYYKEEGSPRREIRVGDVVNILPGVKHWHGASPAGRFAHYAININTEKGIANWLEPVTDNEYNSM